MPGFKTVGAERDCFEALYTFHGASRFLCFARGDYKGGPGSWTSENRVHLSVLHNGGLVRKQIGWLTRSMDTFHRVRPGTGVSFHRGLPADSEATILVRTHPRKNVPYWMGLWGWY
jgi:hypothetical protein